MFSPISSATMPPPTPTTRCRYPSRHRRANRRPRHAGPTIIRGPPIITTTTSRRTQPTTIRTTIRVRRPHPLRRQQRGQQQRAAAFPVKILFVENRRLGHDLERRLDHQVRTRRLPVRRHRTVRPLWCRPRSRWQFPLHHGDNSDVHHPCPNHRHPAACDCRRRAGGQPVRGSAGCGTASCGSAGAGHDRRRRNGCNDRLNATRASRRCINDEVHRNRHACKSAGNPDRHRRDRRRNGGCRGRQHNTCHKSAGRQDRSTEPTARRPTVRTPQPRPARPQPLRHRPSPQGNRPARRAPPARRIPTALPARRQQPCRRTIIPRQRPPSIQSRLPPTAMYKHREIFRRNFPSQRPALLPQDL